ncbi:MAG: ABC transporter substrate-binding protein [Stenotrophobium sp.]
MFRLILTGFAALVVFSVQAMPAPANTVDAFHAALLDNMEHGESLGCAGRTQKMDKAIPDTFDLPFISHLVMKRHWTKLTPAQQATFTATLKNLVIATYAGQFSRHHGETFSTQDTLSLPNGARLVHAKLTRRDDDPVSFDYVLHLDAGHWKVINVVADGVSDLAIRSAQYDRLYSERGYTGLIDFLDKQIAQLRNTCP